MIEKLRDTRKEEFTFFQKLMAWCVHLFTASGLVAGFMAILAINEQAWCGAMLWLVVALVIDGIDGTFARIFRVQEVLPNMNGKTMDYIIYFATYAIIPAYFFHQSGLVDSDFRLPCTILILLVSALYYSKEGMVSDDYYFIGFPVLWNMVVFYSFFVFQFSSIGNILFIVFFAILHFVPIKFVYPSRVKHFRRLTLAVTIILILDFGVILWFYPEKYFWLTLIAIFSAIYYGVMAIYNTWWEE
jgi:Phosphatidylserine synthase